MDPEQAYGRQTFVKRLLHAMAGSVATAGDVRNVKQRIKNIGDLESDKDGFASRVADARFALGVDDGAYLRSNVMPLQTAEGDCDDTLKLSLALAPQLEEAGRWGMLTGIEEALKKKTSEQTKKLEDVLKMVGWMLSINEVARFVKAYIDKLGETFDREARPELEEMETLVLPFLAAGSLEPAARNLWKKENVETSCGILQILLVLFEWPKQSVLGQLKETCGDNGTGTANLSDAITRLSLSARYNSDVKKTDRFRFNSVNVAAQARAIGVNMLATRKVDFTKTSFPSGWDDTDEHEVDGGFNNGVDRMRRLLHKRQDMAARVTARVDDGKSADELIVLLGEAQGSLDTSQRVVSLRSRKQGGDNAKEAEVDLKRAQLEVRVCVQIIATLEAEIAYKRAEELWFPLFEARQSGQFEPVFSDLGFARRIRQFFSTGDETPEEAYDRLDDAKNVAQRKVTDAQRALAELALEQEKLLAQFDADLKTILEENFRRAFVDEAARLQQLEADNTQLEKELADAKRTADDEKKKADELESEKARERAQRRAQMVLQLESIENEKKRIQALAVDKDYCLEAAFDNDLSCNALCAAVSQLREEGGATSNPQFTKLRATGVSPFVVTPHVRPYVRNPAGPADWWSQQLFPGDANPPDPKVGNVLAEAIRDPRQRWDAVTRPRTLDNTDNQMLVYAMSRGLCGHRAPYHQVPDKPIRLAYTTPRVTFPSINVDKDFDGIVRPNPEDANSNRVFDRLRIPARKDFVNPPLPDGSKPVEMKALNVMWAPVEPANVDGETVFVVPSRIDSGEELKLFQSVAEASVLEHLTDDYKIASQGTDVFALGCAAYTKIMQMKSMAKVFLTPKAKSDIAKPRPKVGDGPATMQFVTRPVVLCAGSDSEVLYPCDPGFASYENLAAAYATPADLQRADASANLEAGKAWGKCAPGDDCATREAGDRGVWTPHLRNALAGAGLPYTKIPLYLAAAPALPELVTPAAAAAPVEQSIAETRSVSVTLFAPADEIDEQMSVDRIEALLRHGLHICTTLNKYKCEQKAIEDSKKEGRVSSKPADDYARERREAVWTDALREACIAGDRLYAFVRQLSGTISENVDAVCQIDEGMLVRQQQQRREQMQRLADRAAQEHMQLVRGVFSSVLKESGLALGIESNGPISELKVTSNVLRKQASELASGSAGTSEGYFTNSVRLENLLSQGTGDMKLSDLFDRIQDAGIALQRAALSGQPAEGVPGANASLDFLSAPRNSLMLRYKPEALAAMRQSFDTFQREMRTQHGRMHRAISAYELIEGKDEELCTAFATFAAHMLVNSRMYSSATAMYVAAWPAAANIQQLKISLQRLVRVAVEYLVHCSGPIFTADNGRDRYFGNADCAPRYLMPPRPLFYKGNPEQINFYGNR